MSQPVNEVITVLNSETIAALRADFQETKKFYETYFASIRNCYFSEINNRELFLEVNRSNIEHYQSAETALLSILAQLYPMFETSILSLNEYEQLLQLRIEVARDMRRLALALREAQAFLSLEDGSTNVEDFWDRCQSPFNLCEVIIRDQRLPCVFSKAKVASTERILVAELLTSPCVELEEITWNLRVDSYHDVYRQDPSTGLYVLKEQSSSSLDSEPSSALSSASSSPTRSDSGKSTKKKAKTDAPLQTFISVDDTLERVMEVTPTYGSEFSNGDKCDPFRIVTFSFKANSAMNKIPLLFRAQAMITIKKLIPRAERKECMDLINQAPAPLLSPYSQPFFVITNENQYSDVLESLYNFYLKTETEFVSNRVHRYHNLCRFFGIATRALFLYRRPFDQPEHPAERKRKEPGFSSGYPLGDALDFRTFSLAEFEYIDPLLMDPAEQQKTVKWLCGVMRILGYENKVWVLWNEGSILPLEPRENSKQRIQGCVEKPGPGAFAIRFSAPDDYFAGLAIMYVNRKNEVHEVIYDKVEAQRNLNHIWTYCINSDLIFVWRSDRNGTSGGFVRAKPEDGSERANGLPRYIVDDGYERDVVM